MNERLKEELITKRKELEWKNNLRSLEVINWIDELLKKIEEPAEPAPKAPKEVIVDLPDREPEEKKEVKKPGKTQKIVFKKK